MTIEDKEYYELKDNFNTHLKECDLRNKMIEKELSAVKGAVNKLKEEAQTNGEKLNRLTDSGDIIKEKVNHLYSTAKTHERYWLLTRGGYLAITVIVTALISLIGLLVNIFR